MNALERQYFLTEDGKPDEFLLQLGCDEKIFYHKLCNYNVDPNVIFINDINISLVCDDNFLGMYLNQLHINDALFQQKFYDVQNVEDALMLIESLIDKGETVAMRTMFDMLPAYGWYTVAEKKGVSDTHRCLIVGYDSENYFIAEDPSMIDSVRGIKHATNPTITLIEKSHLADALGITCEISTVHVNREQVMQVAASTKIAERFAFVKEQVVKTYYSEQALSNVGGYIGRQAINKLLEVFKEGDRKFIDMFANNYFNIYLAYTRRMIFMHNLKLVVDGANDRVEVALLDKLIAMWVKIYKYAIKNSIKPITDIHVTFYNLLYQIKSLEDRLMSVLAD